MPPPKKAVASRTRAPWYANGLPFACQPDCGRCCSRHDDYSYLYLQAEDVPRLAAQLEMTPSAFRRRFTAVEDGYLILRMDGPDCPFLEGKRCGVYEGRPTQCRTFPFWRETLRTPKAWNDLRSFCPGIGQGDVHSLITIRERLVERRDS